MPTRLVHTTTPATGGDMQGRMLLGSVLVAAGVSAVVLPALSLSEGDVGPLGLGALEVSSNGDRLSLSQIGGAVAAATGLALIALESRRAP
jgi:hypothetical protein